MASISFMYEIKDGSKTLTPRTWETDVDSSLSFADVFRNISPGNDDASVTVEIGHKLPHRDPSQFVQVRLHQKVELLNMQGANFVRFKIVSHGTADGIDDSTPPVLKNAFEIMATAATRLRLPPSKPTANENNKIHLFNDVLDYLKDNNVGFRPGTELTTGEKFVSSLTQCIWDMDCHWKTLADQHILKPAFVQRIYDNSGKTNYNDYASKKIAKPRLSQEMLKDLIDTNSEYLQTTWMNGKVWKEVRNGLSELVNVLSQYCKYLVSQNEKTKKNHASMEVIRSPIVDSECFTLEASSHVLPSLAELDEIVASLPVYEPYFLNDLSSVSQMSKHQRYHLFTKLSKNGLSYPIVYFKYSPHAGIATYHFIWKIPKDTLERDNNSYFRLSSDVSKNISTYHTRAMKAEYQEHFSSICNLKPAVHRAMYSFLTGDSSSQPNQKSKDIEERVNVALSNNDKDFIFDLRQHNAGRPEIYAEFWEALAQVMNADLPPAVQERRENATMYMPIFMSTDDLIKKVQDLKPDVKVPSESWILLQFTPKDKRRHTALNYTSRFDIVYKMQSRSLHKNHPDRYYCMALFKYLRTFAVKHRDFAVFFCEDDKHLVSVGEPDEPIAALDRNRKVMVPKDVELVALDHDYKRFKICPSVILNNEIPDTIDDSFYHGQVFVGVKDAVFQKSTPLRHAVEKQSCFNNDSEWKEIECDYSDGGPDHNVNHYSVKIGHICHFLRKDLDMLAAAITYPGGSYVDPAERVMPLLNIAMNGVALAREKLSESEEKQIRNCNSMDALRKVAETDPELEKSLRESVSTCINLLEDRFSRVALKDIPIKTIVTATDEDEASLFEEMSRVDSTLQIDETNKAQVIKHDKFMSWLHDHSIERRYIFQLKKCVNAPTNTRLLNEAAELVELVPGIPDMIVNRLKEAIHNSDTCYELWELVNAAERNANDDELFKIISTSRRDPCSVCTPPRLPLGTFMSLNYVPDPMPVDGDDSKFKKFEEVYGTQTKEIFRPSFVENLDEGNKAMLVKEKARLFVKCIVCTKPRVVYGDAKSYKANLDTVQQHLEVVHFSCGSPFFPEEHSLHSSLVVRMMLSCEDLVEMAYYSSKKFKDVCIYCGSVDDIVPVPDELNKKFRCVYPLCASCQASKKKHHTRMPVLAGQKRKAK